MPSHDMPPRHRADPNVMAKIFPFGRACPLLGRNAPMATSPEGTAMAVEKSYSSKINLV